MIILLVLIYLDCKGGKPGHSCKTDFLISVKAVSITGDYFNIMKYSEEGGCYTLKTLQLVRQGWIEDNVRR